MRINLVRISANAKLGPIPAAYVSEDTCPLICPLRKAGCYGDRGPVQFAWRKVSNGTTGTDWPTFIGRVKELPRHTLWRYGVVGDLPSEDGVLIDSAKFPQLVAANRGRKGFLFTHYDPFIGHNGELIKAANQGSAGGFTVNLSADNLQDVDTKVALGIGPVVTLLPKDAGKVTYTPGGVRVVTCPNHWNKDITCSTCGICQDADRKAVIGFPAHGSSWRKAEAVFKTIRVKVIQDNGIQDNVN